MELVLPRTYISRGLQLRIATFAAILGFIGICFFVKSVGFPHGRPYALFLSYKVTPFFIAAGSLLIIVQGVRKRSWREILLVVVTLALVTLLVHVMKFSFGPLLPRPTGSEGGFPSGHAATTFALAFLLSQRFPRLRVSLYTLAAAIAWGRIGMCSHFIYQVVFGALLGLELAIYLDRRFSHPPMQGKRVWLSK